MNMRIRPVAAEGVWSVVRKDDTFFWKLPEDWTEDTRLPAGFSMSFCQGLGPWRILCCRSDGAVLPADTFPTKQGMMALDNVLEMRADGWIVWEGGVRPVAKGTVVDVKHRSGEVHMRCQAGVEGEAAFSWVHGYLDEPTDPADIIAFRPSLPASQDW